MTLISVVIPVYFNAATLPELLRRLRDVAAAMRPLEFEFVCVDDGSGDESFAVIATEGSSDPRVRGVRLSRNFGPVSAVVAGLTCARGDCLIVMAADLQDPPEVIPRMVAAWQDGAEVILAAREGRDDPLVPRMWSALFYRALRLWVFPDFPKQGFDFVAVSRRVGKIIASVQEKNSHIPGQVFWLGFRRAIVHYRRQPRGSGKSRFTFSRRVKMFIDAFAAFSYVPLRLAGFLGIVLALTGFGLATSVAVSRLTGLIDEPPGFSALMVAVLVVGGAQLVVSAVIGEYTWRVLEEARRRPLFVVDSTVNLDPPVVDDASRPPLAIWNVHGDRARAGEPAPADGPPR